MQAYGNDQRTAQGHPDGGRDAEQPAANPADQLAHTEVPDQDNGALRVANLSASISGKGRILS